MRDLLIKGTFTCDYCHRKQPVTQSFSPPGWRTFPLQIEITWEDYNMGVEVDICPDCLPTMADYRAVWIAARNAIDAYVAREEAYAPREEVPSYPEEAAP